MDTGGDKNVLHRIVRLYSSIAQAKITHPLEKNDLQIILESINELVFIIIVTRYIHFYLFF